MTIRRLVFATAAAALIAACGDADPDDPDGDERSWEEIEQEVCTHATERAFEAEATAEFDDVDPAEADIGVTHNHFRTELLEHDDGYHGWVAFDVSDRGDEEYAIFTSADAELTFYDTDGEELDDQPNTEAFDACAELTQTHLIELPAGDYRLYFDAVDVEEISTVTESIDDVS